jgi:hypothetical protein
MTGRAELVLNAAAIRERAIAWVRKAPTGTRLTFKAPQRTVEQNSRLWAMLSDVATQHRIAGHKYTTDQWKVMFLHAWAREVGRELQYLPNLNGAGLVPYGSSSSDLSVSEMTGLIEWIFMWGAENGTIWSDPTREEERATA